MENASKALIIAGGILIGILIISIGVLFWNSTASVSQNYDEKLENDRINEYNNKFLIYAKDLNAQELVSIYNLIVENNKKYEGINERQIKLEIEGADATSKISEERLIKWMQDEVVRGTEDAASYKFNGVTYRSNGYIESMSYGTKKAGYASDPDTCEHVFGPWAQKDDSTHTRMCNRCGTVDEQEHQWGNWYFSNPEKGEQKRECEADPDCIAQQIRILTYNIDFYGNNSTSGSMATLPMTYGIEKNLPTNQYIRTGHSFKEWNTNTDGSGTKYSDGDLVNNLTQTYKGSVPLYAQWTANTYTIGYSLNGGTNNSQNPASFIYGTSVTLKDPSKPGHTFAGWYYNSSFSGSRVTSISNTTASNVTLYAKWTVNNYYLDLNGLLDGSSAGNISGYGTADVYINGTLQSNDCTDYYTQLPYGTRYEIKDIKAVTGHTYNGVSSGSLSGTIGEGAVTVQLKFTTNKYTIAYNKGTATGGTLPQNQTATYGRSIALGTNSMTKSNTNLGTVTFNYNGSGAGNTTSTAYTTYVANGWATSSGGGRSYTNGQSVSNLATGGTFNLYPSFTGTAHSATFPSPSRNGYRFEGWYTAASGGSKVTSYTGASNVTYYAHWTALSYTIAFNSNGGSGSMSNQSVNPGATVNLSANRFTAPSGYTFAGWAKTYNKQGTDYTNGQSVKDLTSAGNTITLYAKWYCSGGRETTCPGGTLASYCCDKPYTISVSREYWVCRKCGAESSSSTLAWSGDCHGHDMEYRYDWTISCCGRSGTYPQSGNLGYTKPCEHGYTYSHTTKSNCTHGKQNAHYYN